MLLAVLVAIFLIVVLGELLWRIKLLDSEHARKFIHIAVGSFAASWAFILDDTFIVLLSLAMFIVVLLSRVFKIFGSIHTVNRKTWGELFFPLGIAAAALLADSAWVFAAAILHVSIADGMAAVVGRRHIKRYGYKVFGHQKTLIGTLVFFNISVVICGLALMLSPELQVSIVPVLLVPFLATLTENVSSHGADDFMIPLIVAGMLSVF